MKADSLRIDDHRRTETRPEQPLIEIDKDGHERLREVESQQPSPEQEAAAKEIERGFGRFLLKLRLRTRLDNRAVADRLAGKMFPASQTDQFSLCKDHGLSAGRGQIRDQRTTSRTSPDSCEKAKALR